MSDAPQKISHYRVERLLGAGGMGAVYLATDRRDQGPVAIKLLHPHLSADPAFRERFEREAHIAALLRSPYTVHVLDHGVVRGQCFIAMEYVRGQTLKEVLASGPLAPRRAVHIALQVARALEEAEARGVVHRDVKPENILLRGEDSVKVTDFGIARHIGTPAATAAGAFVGTLSYAAPEQLLGTADHRADIYALGATLYHMLAGQPPFVGDLPQTLDLIRSAPPPAEPLAHLPAALRECVQRCLEKDPADRYQSSSLLANALTVVEREDVGASHGGTTFAGAESVIWQSVSMQLARGNTRAPFADRLRAAQYDLSVRNDSDQVIDLALSAEEDDAGCRFDLPDRLSLPPNATTRAVVKVTPRKRRWRGDRESRVFSVYGSIGGGGPPTVVSGQYQDQPYGWLPVGAGMAIIAPAAVLIALSMSAGFGQGDEQTAPLKIGVLAPFSGQLFAGDGPPAAEYGQAYLNAARIAVSEINADGGVLGQPVALAQGDSAGDPDVAVQEARRLVEEGVQAIVGPFDPNLTVDVSSQVTDPMRIVQITPSYGLAMLRKNSRGAPVNNDPAFLFESAVKPESEGVVIAKMLVEGGYATACVISEPRSTRFDALPKDAVLIEDIIKRFATGVRVVDVEHTPEILPGAAPAAGEQLATDARNRARTDLAACTGSDALVLNVQPEYPAPEVTARSFILEEALNEGVEHIFVSSALLGFDLQAAQILPIGSQPAAGIRGTRGVVEPSVQGDVFDAEYKKRFGVPPENMDPIEARRVYDAVYLIALATEKAGTTDSDAIRRALWDVANAPGTVVKPGPEGGDSSSAGGFKDGAALLAAGTDIDYEGAAGAIEFDDHRDNVRAAVASWHVEAQTRSLVDDQTLIVDLASGEAVPYAGRDLVRSGAFTVPIALAPAPGFLAVTNDAPTDFALERASSQSGADAYLSFLSPTAVFDANNEPIDVPKDLLAWIENKSGVEIVSEASAVDIGGHPGTRIDVRGDGTGARLFEIGAKQFTLGRGEVARFLLVDVNGKTIVIAGGALFRFGTGGAPEPGFDDPSLQRSLRDIDAMLATVKFE